MTEATAFDDCFDAVEGLLDELDGDMLLGKLDDEENDDDDNDELKLL